MKGTRLLAVTLALALVTAGFASAQTKIQVVSEGFLGGFGELDDAIAGYLKSKDQGSDENAKRENAYRWEKWTAIKNFLAPQKITTEAVDWGWAETLTQKQVQSALAKIGPDVWVGETQMPGFVAQGLLEPFPAALEKKVKETLVPGAYSAMEYKGKLYGLTATPSVSILFWNKDLLKKAGLDPEKAPKTWAELKANADKITAAGKGQFYGGGVYVGPNFGGSLRYYAWILENGGDVVDTNMAPTLNSAKVVEAVKFFKDLDKNIPAGVAGDPDEGAFWNAFNQGKIAYIVDGSWRKSASDDNKIDVGYAAMPLPRAGAKEIAVGIGMPLFGVPTYAKNKTAAFKFIEALIDTKIQSVDVKYGIRPAVLKSLQYDDDYMASYNGAFYKTFLSSVKGMPTFGGNQNAKIWEIFHNAVTEAVVTPADPKTVLDAAQKRAQGLK